MMSESPSTTKMQFAFQGGGAKLGSLLVAAEAIYNQTKTLNYLISRVSGTSAGAIVACILATGEDPALFRERLINLATARLGNCADMPPRKLRAACRFCCKSLKTPGDKFPARRPNKPRSLIDVASGSLPRSPVSLSLGDEVPHMFTRKPHLRLEKFAITCTKRLLQQNLPTADSCTATNDVHRLQ
jgi:hypothetical protein